jgi:integrase
VENALKILQKVEMHELTTNTDVQQLLATMAPYGGNGVMDDSQALSGWLIFVEHRNTQTFRSYQAEALRFRIFLETLHGKNPDRAQAHLMRDASEADIMLYEAVLSGHFKNGKEAPIVQVPREVMIRHGRERQPFVVEHESSGLIQYKSMGLKASSVNQALTILHALYQYWMRPDPQTKSAYVGANPVKRIKSASNRMQRQTSRNFPMEAITAMMETLESQRIAITPDVQEIKSRQIARRRWIVAMFFGLWGRRAELAQLKMGDFQHNGTRWTVHLRRKGGKEQDLPVAPWVVQEMARYRASLGLSPLPNPSDESPAVARLRNRAEDDEAPDKPPTPVHADTLYREITTTAKDTAAAVRCGIALADVDPVQRELVAKRLDEISPHWFRHSGASIAINSGAMSLDNASKMLGHSSPTITAEMYYHPDEAQIEEGMQQLGAKAFG